jgi:formate C-acetyltransferase
MTMSQAPIQSMDATMTERVKALRNRTLEARPRISPERARLLTEFRKSRQAECVSIPLRQALGFKFIMEHKELYLGEGELFIGERGPAPAAVTTYPELCAHSLQDLEILDTREKIPYAVDAATRKIYAEEIIPFWQGKTQRERLLGEMTPEWINAYEAGIFTEFQEQRSPGHTVLGDKMFSKGFLDLKEEIARAIAALDFFHDPDAYDKKEELRAMDIACDAIVAYGRRNAELLEARAAAESDPERKRELETMAAICRRVPAGAPTTFWEALQHYWFIHVGVITEMNPWDSFNPGRLDQHLWPFYKREIEAGSLTPEFARELLQAFWTKFHDHPAPPKVGVTAAESGTYTDFCLINLGGVKQDGSDAVNDLTYVILDVIQEMRLVQPSSMVQISKKNPDRYLKRALRICATGFGQPSIFNTDAIVAELLRQGKSIEDARAGGASGCVEAGAFGKEAYILSGYFNIPKVLEMTLHNGYDPRTKKQIGPKTGEPDTFQTFGEFYAAFEKQIRHFVDIKVRGNNVIDRLYAKYLPAPFMSTLIDDCIANGKDYHAGGARYNTTYIQGVGIGTISDCLASIKFNVFERHHLTLKQMVETLDANFEDHEELRRLFLDGTPKYGNDDDRADDLMRMAFETYYRSVNGRPNGRGGTHRVDMLPTTCHVYFGSVCGALPDGRLATVPLSEGISPVQGADRKGPTSVLKSAAKLDHLRTGGTLLNQKFTPSFMADDAGITKVAQLVRSYFRMDGHHVQFNVVDAATLRKAQEHPDQYRDLIVRVAGYSDYFVNLCQALQDEIIHRTEHMEVS